MDRGAAQRARLQVCLAVANVAHAPPGGEVRQRPERLNDEREHPCQLGPTHLGSRPMCEVPKRDRGHNHLSGPCGHDRPLMRRR